jgi:hypothetical protein
MNSFLVFVSLLAIWPMSGAKKYPMTADPSIPAATGTVEVKKDKKNGNIQLDIKVDHLAKPASLTPPEDVYIVWIRPSDKDAQKVGEIGLDKNLKGELRVVTTSKNFDVFITAEQSESVNEPSTLQLLRAHVSP